MADTGAPPIIPANLRPYNSYEQDPKWQIRFTIAWTSFLGLFILAALPRFVRRAKKGILFKEVTGLTEDMKGYEKIAGTPETETALEEGSGSQGRRGATNTTESIAKFLNVLGSIVYWSPPWLELNAGQIFIICAYLAVTITCIVSQVPLLTNPNRAGFLALAQLPPVFLFATRNSVVSLLLGPGVGYGKLGFVHSVTSYGLFLAALIHGALWIRDHLKWGMPILSQQKETSGIACFALLCIIALTSLRPVRRYVWNVFWIIHFLCFVAFFITVCYHTTYARPWIYAPLALYGLDLLMRMVKARIQEAFLIPADRQMTLVHIPYTTSGWTPGQHVRLRVFFDGRIFESHPLTIMCAPPSEGCLAKPPPLISDESRDTKANAVTNEKSHGKGTEGGTKDSNEESDPDSQPQDDLGWQGEYAGSGILLGARTAGDWTKALNSFTYREGERLRRRHNHSSNQSTEERKHTSVPVHVMVDGPYGGCSIDPSSYETVLLVSGGSGATFTISLLDDLVGRCLKSSQVVTRRIEFVWFLRSFGAITWFAGLIRTIALHAATCPDLELHVTIYVTCICVVEDVPTIPNCDVLKAQPGVTQVVRRVVDGSPDPVKAIEEGDFVLDGKASGADDKKVEMNEKVKEVEKAENVVGNTDTKDGSCSSTPDSATGVVPVGNGGFAVCASGPERLTREAANAVAQLCASKRGRELGRIGLHTELYAV